MIAVIVQDAAGTVLASASGPEEILLSVDRVYQPGDRILVSGAAHLRVQMDQALPSGEVYLPEEKKFATKRGELVRSKSEAMIADCYYELGIPYKNAQPINLFYIFTVFPLVRRYQGLVPFFRCSDLLSVRRDLLPLDLRDRPSVRRRNCNYRCP